MVYYQLALVFLLLHVLDRLLFDRQRGQLDGLCLQEEGRDDPVVDAVVPVGLCFEFGHLVGLHDVVDDALVELHVVFLLAQLDHEVFAVANVLALEIVDLVLGLFVLQLPLFDDLTRHVHFFFDRGELLLHIHDLFFLLLFFDGELLCRLSLLFQV